MKDADGKRVHRKNISHSVIFDYWRNKYITPEGDITTDPSNPDNEKVVRYLDEPECWCCKQWIDGLDTTQEYQKIIADGDARKLYDLPLVKRKLQRCHITPFAIDRDNEQPSNLFLMCESCHLKSPDIDNPKMFLRWIWKQRKLIIMNGHNITGIVNDIIDECESLGLNPQSGNIDDANISYHNNSVSDSSIVMGYVGTCKKSS